MPKTKTTRRLKSGPLFALILPVGWFVLWTLASAHAQYNPSPDEQALVDAADQGDLVKIRALLNQGVSVDAQDKNGCSALCYAAYHGNQPLVTLLLQKGATVDIQDKNGLTPFFQAAQPDHTDICLQLLGLKADPNIKSKWNQNALMYAAKFGDLVLLKALLSRQVDTSVVSNYGTVFSWALSSDVPNRLEIVRLLLDHGADVNLVDKQGRTPLMEAMEYSEALTIGRLLLDRGAKLDEQDSSGRTALMFAAEWGTLDTVKMLVKAGADLDLADAQGETALTHAGSLGATDCVEYLKSRGARRTDVHLLTPPKSPKPLSPTQSWILGLGAIYYYSNHGYATSLNGCLPYNVLGLKKNLADWWEVHNSKEFLGALYDLSKDGWRTRYLQWAEISAKMSDDQISDWIKSSPNPKEAPSLGRVKAARLAHQTWGERTGLAWDLCRYVYLISEGYKCGYIDEKSAWDLLLPQAQKLQKSFDSWTEMNENFFAGRTIWLGGEEARDQEDAAMRAISALLLDPNQPSSPWIANPWNTTLQDSE